DDRDLEARIAALELADERVGLLESEPSVDVEDREAIHAEAHRHVDEHAPLGAEGGRDPDTPFRKTRERPAEDLHRLPAFELLAFARDLGRVDHGLDSSGRTAAFHAQLLLPLGGP